MIKSLSNEYGPYNVLVNNVCPGFTATASCNSGGHSFAGGRLALVQWGYPGQFPGAYQGPISPYDQDYACGPAAGPHGT